MIHLYQIYKSKKGQLYAGVVEIDHEAEMVCYSQLFRTGKAFGDTNRETRMQIHNFLKRYELYSDQTVVVGEVYSPHA